MNNRMLNPFRLSVIGTAVTLCALGNAARAQEQMPTPVPTPAPMPTPAAQPPPAPTDASMQAAVRPPRRYPFVRVQRPFRVQVGGLFATDDRVRDDINSSLLYVGATLDIAATQATRPIIISAYVDGVYGQNDNEQPIIRMESLGIGLSARTYFSATESSTRYYGGLGLGAYTVTSKRDRLEDIPAFIGDLLVSRLRYFARGSTKTSFGGKLFVGAEFNRRFFGELGFTAAGSALDYSPTGALLSAGVRF